MKKDKTNKVKKKGRATTWAIVFTCIVIVFILFIGIAYEDADLKKINASIGQTFTLSEAEVKVNKIYFSNYAAGNVGRAEDGYKWIVVNATIHNPTNHEIELSYSPIPLTKYRTWSTKILYDNEYTYDGTYYNYTDFLDTVDKVIPLGSKTGVYAFRVPAEVERSNKPLVFTIQGGSTKVTIDIRK